MLEGGQRWLPPPMTLTTGSHQTAAQRGGELKVGNFEAGSCPAITAMTGGQGGRWACTSSLHGQLPALGDEHRRLLLPTALNPRASFFLQGVNHRKIMIDRIARRRTRTRR